MSGIKKTIEKDQIIRFETEHGAHIAVVTKILNNDYVSCIESDGTVHPCVYRGYIDPPDGTKLMLSNVLEELKMLDRLKDVKKKG